MRQDQIRTRDRAIKHGILIDVNNIADKVGLRYHTVISRWLGCHIETGHQRFGLNPPHLLQRLLLCTKHRLEQGHDYVNYGYDPQWGASCKLILEQSELTILHRDELLDFRIPSGTSLFPM